MADIHGVRFDLVHPTPQQLRDGVTCGLIAESIMVPVLLTLTIVNHRTVHWGYMVGAIACIVASVAYQSVFTLITRGEAGVRSQGHEVEARLQPAAGVVQTAGMDAHRHLVRLAAVEDALHRFEVQGIVAVATGRQP